MQVLVDSARKLNRQAQQIANTFKVAGKSVPRRPRGELQSALDELEETLAALRAVTAIAPAPSGRARSRPAARLVLDTTEAMIRKHHLVSPVEFQDLMGWATRQAVWKAAQGHRVFYLAHGAERYFPTFYGDPAYDRKHLEAVTKILGDLPGGAKLQFFLTRKGSLNGATPLEALATGRFAKVKDVAAAFAEVPPGDRRQRPARR